MNLSTIFAPAVHNAARLEYLHKRIERMVDKGVSIDCMFHAGRIGFLDKEILLDVYVRDCP